MPILSIVGINLSTRSKGKDPAVIRSYSKDDLKAHCGCQVDSLGVARYIDWCALIDVATMDLLKMPI